VRRELLDNHLRVGIGGDRSLLGLHTQADSEDSRQFRLTAAEQQTKMAHAVPSQRRRPRHAAAQRCDRRRRGRLERRRPHPCRCGPLRHRVHRRYEILAARPCRICGQLLACQRRRSPAALLLLASAAAAAANPTPAGPSPCCPLLLKVLLSLDLLHLSLQPLNLILVLLDLQAVQAAVQARFWRGSGAVQMRNSAHSSTIGRGTNHTCMRLCH
jgi:hypothetical protein